MPARPPRASPARPHRIPDVSLPRLLYISNDEGLGLAEVGTNPSPEPRRLLDPVPSGLAASWPVPDPNGDTALVSGVGRDAFGEQHLELLQISFDGETPPRVLFRNDPASAQLIAPGVAHYASWAPDGGLVALVGRDGESLGLSLLQPGGQAPARTLLHGAPLFTAWAPDGHTLAVHAGDELRILDVQQEVDERILHDQARFRTPVWDQAGKALFYVAPGARGRDLLWRSHHDGTGRDVVTQVEGPTALLASPHGEQLALLTLAEGSLEGHNLRLLDPASGEQQLVERGPIHAALWHPDGRSLFGFLPSGPEPDFALHRFDLSSGRGTPLARFRPSPAYRLYLTFFDQYVRSHSLVSEDGRWLVVSGTIATNGAGSRQPPGPQWGCYAVSTDGSAPLQQIASGEIGFFAPPITKTVAPGGCG